MEFAKESGSFDMLGIDPFGLGGKYFHDIKYCNFPLCLRESKTSLTLKCCSPLIRTGVGGVFVGQQGKVIAGFNRLQWKTRWSFWQI